MTSVIIEHKNKQNKHRHMERDNTRECGICGSDYTFTGKTRFEIHIELIHNNSDVPLNDANIEKITISAIFSSF